MELQFIPNVDGTFSIMRDGFPAGKANLEPNEESRVVGKNFVDEAALDGPENLAEIIEKIRDLLP